MRIPLIILCAVLVVSSYVTRFITFQTQHPDNDELFELKDLQQRAPADIFKNNVYYGDHTSFPGEYLSQYLPIKELRLFDYPANIDIENRTIKGISKSGFWLIAIPKIILSVVGLILFLMCVWTFVKSDIGRLIAVAFLMLNGSVIYHSFSLRPYGILPELAIINLFLCVQVRKELWFSLFHGVVLFFTITYHAYGPLVALLPLLYFRNDRSKEFIGFVFFGILFWIHYGVTNNLGFSPGARQSVVDPFQFMTRSNFINDFVESLFGGSIITIAIIPAVLLSIRFVSARLVKFGLWFIVLPIVLIMAIDIKTHYWIHPRQYIWVLPAIAIWCGSAVDGLMNRLERI